MIRVDWVKAGTYKVQNAWGFPPRKATVNWYKSRMFKTFRAAEAFAARLREREDTNDIRVRF